MPVAEPNKPDPGEKEVLKKDEASRLAGLLKKDDQTKEKGEGFRLDDVIWPAQRAGWAIERHVIWPVGDFLRRLADAATWPFERAIWALRSRVAWPVQDEFNARGRPVRTVLAVSAVGLAVAAAGAGALTSSSGGGSDRAAQVPAVAVAVVKPAPPKAPRTPLAFVDKSKLNSGPVLHGVAPTFKVANAKSISKDPADSAKKVADPVDTPPATPGKDTGTDAADPTTFNAKDSKVPPATVKPALDVSRQFADAFVLYEVGKGDNGVNKTFKKTAAKNLVRALKKRPPRLPKGIKVPKAEVLNVVPGPRHGKALSVSVALVRLGASSELRLELRHDEKAGWLVSDVRG